MKDICGELDTAEDLACPKCHMFGCDCDEPEVVSPFRNIGPLSDERAVCVVCRRARPSCICKSHVEMPRVALTQSGDPIPPKNIEAQVIEGMAFYYQRDAAGLQRWLRGLLKSRT